MQDLAVHPRPTTAAVRSVPIAFTGSGSEYFRIWIVNLLLIVVTLGLYLPFAKARRLQYFYSNTVVDGHALAFHGDPWRMLRGHLLMATLLGAYFVAGKISLGAALAAYVILWAVWPALWRAGMQFRMANTSWRGVRMGFTGSLVDAYKAYAPIVLPSIALVALPVMLGGEPNLTPSDDPAQVAANMERSLWLLGGGLVLMLLMPWTWALFKRYQHNHYVYAGERSQLDATVRTFYFVVLKIAALGLGLMVLGGFLMGVAFGVAAVSGSRTAALWGGVGVALIMYLLFFMLVAPYAVSRMQNLVWSRTATQHVRFDSALGFRPFMKLNVKNWLLVLFTLGLYRPFAAIDSARMRLQAVTLHIEGDMSEWIAAAQASNQRAAGDAAGDLFGIDFGL